jgi:hypothetical protein
VPQHLPLFQAARSRFPPARRLLSNVQNGSVSERPGRVAASVRPTARSRADAWPLDDELRATAAAWGIVPERDLVLV